MATDSNLSHCLSYVNSQFKWKGDIDQLKAFVKTTLLLTGGWSSPEVNPPKFTGQNVFMTFYKSTTLQIHGKDPDKTNLIKRLREIATSEKGSTSSSSEIASRTMAEGGNKCNGECHPIYPTEDQHIKQRVGDERFLGSKGQFCAAFYHVHQWNHREHSCLDDNHCIVAKEAKSPTGWYVDARKVVAVVKFEGENGDILYEARYKSCAPEQKHAVDFFKEDIENENGELRKLVEDNPNGTITLYLPHEPCNMSTSIGGAAFTPPDKTCCETLTMIVNAILQPTNTSLCVKAANTCRLSLTPEDDPDDETLRQNAVAGIKMLMQVGVTFSGMTEEDWKYLLSFTDVLEGYEHLVVHGNHQHLDASVQNIFDQIQAQINPA